MKKFDVIVIGGGPMGLAASAELAKSGRSTLLLEQYQFLNQKGSSAGLSRQFRLQYAQKYMAQLALDAIPYWDELQENTSKLLIDNVGSLWFGDPEISSQEGGIQAAMKVMSELDIPYSKLTAGQIEEQFPFKNIPENYIGFFQKDGGIINLQATQEALYNICRNASNVDLCDRTAVTNIESLETGEIIVSTAGETYVSEKLVITPGAFINDILRFFGLSVNIDIWEMSSAYYRKKEEIKFPTWFVFQKPQNTSLFYGFPEEDWAHPGYIRVAPDIPDRIIQDPSQRTNIPSTKSLGFNEEWVKNHMEGLNPQSEFTSTCLITLSNNNKELLLDTLPDTIPNNRNIIIYSAGWAAKFIPLIGKIMAELALTGQTSYDISQFKIDYNTN